MNGLLDQAEGPVGIAWRQGDSAASSIFDVTAFIEEADLGDGREALPAPIVEPPPESWQDAVGRRLLTPLEEAARERYFDRKASVAIAAARRLRRRCA